MMPEGWKRVKISSVLDKIIDYRGKSVPKAEHGVPLITTRNVKMGYLDMSHQEFIKESDYNNWMSRGIPKKDDIIFTTEAPLGNVCMFPEKGLYTLGQRMIVVRTKTKTLDSNYFFQYLMSEKCQNSIYVRSSGSTAKGIKSSEFKKIKIFLPPLAEQKKIAEILSTWDDAIQTTEKLIECSRLQKKALMQQLLTGKKRLPGFSGVWRSFHLDELAEVISSPVDKKSQKGERKIRLCNYTDVYYNQFITNDIPFMEATAKDSQIEKYSLFKNDVIITKDSESPDDIAVSAIVRDNVQELLCGYHLVILRPKTRIFGEFLNYMFSLKSIRYYFYTLATGATRFGLPIGGIKKAKLKVPPLDEQKAIAGVLNDADREIELYEQKLEALKLEKKALMQQLLTGKRRVIVDESVREEDSRDSCKVRDRDKVDDEAQAQLTLSLK